MLKAKKRTVLTAIAACSLLTLPYAAYADPTGNETQGTEAEAPVPTPTPEASSVEGQTRAAPLLVTIPDIQTPGEGDDSHLVNTHVTTKGVVTALYPKGENANLKGLDGFVIQTPGTGGPWDPNRKSSDGLFVYMAKSSAAMPALGDCVVITGKVAEYPATGKKTPASTQSLTQVLPDSIQAISDCEPVQPTALSSVPTKEQMEALESMLVMPTGAWAITDNYKVHQYGTLSLTPGHEPLRSATDVVAPGAEAQAYEAANKAKTIDLDDGSTTNLTNFKEKAHTEHHAYLANGVPLRVGDLLYFSKPVILDSRYSNFVFQPTQMTAGFPGRGPFTAHSERPVVPAVKGDTKVATFNVLNYFSDLGENEAGCQGYPDREGKFVTDKNCKLRGAWSAQAFANQQSKIVQAINMINADVVALEEIENPVAAGVSSDRDGALKNLVDALNGAAGSEVWAYVPSPSVVPANEDVIRIAFIYKKKTITPIGESVIHDDPAYTGLARQPLAQEFTPIVDANHQGQNFVVIANHFKSKGSVPKGMEAGNTDNGDGQGNSNAIRVAQARALATFAKRFEGTPTLLVGDFNSYSKEDPLKVLTDAGWEHQFVYGPPSYVYAGRSGSLDHVFANSAASPFVTEVKSWAVNAQEAVAFEYSRANYNAFLAFQADNPYRASDHNPEIVGLNLITPIQGPTTPPSQPSTQPSAPVEAPAQTALVAKPSPKHSLASTGISSAVLLLAGACVLMGTRAATSPRRSI